MKLCRIRPPPHQELVPASSENFRDFRERLALSGLIIKIYRDIDVDVHIWLLYLSPNVYRFERSRSLWALDGEAQNPSQTKAGKLEVDRNPTDS